MHALTAIQHVSIRRPCGIVPLIVFARPIQFRQSIVYAGIGGSGLRWIVGSVERQGWRPGERRAHQRQGAEHIRPHQCAPCRHRRAEIVPDHRGHGSISQRGDKTQCVAHRIQQAERCQVASVVVVGVPAGGAAITPQIRRHDMVAGRGQQRHQPAPRICQFREAVQQQHAGPIGGFEPSLQHVDAQSVDVGHEARADADGQYSAVQWRDPGAAHRPLSHAAARSNAASMRAWRAFTASRSPACVST